MRLETPQRTPGSTKMIQFATSSWATWPLVVGIAIPITGLTALFMLGVISFLRRSGQEHHCDMGHPIYQKRNELECSSQSSGSTSLETALPAPPRSEPSRPIRPPRPQMSTEECLRIISRRRLETIRESTRWSMEQQAPQKLSNFPAPTRQLSEDPIRRLDYARQVLEGGQSPKLSVSHSSHGGRIAVPKSGERSSPQPPQLVKSCTQRQPRNVVELDHLKPPFRLQEGNWTYDRTDAGSRRLQPIARSNL
nr:hypothetical protein CFP56_07843 [Quercus suber]